ncbi:hypothetical protein [Klebsiella grimontii]|uniref:hypothetical protein n=1 Tax=Klebsiella grimontii TaxID=2058152 RepID=UPI001DA7A06C|nr:hypothetical protein [Klebsiella grimontii]EGT0063688.1 hypothetical protein [Klebsiella michiganensis]WDI73023.1 hypothetical protein PU992_12590 [Klebsiella grimontii]
MNQHWPSVAVGVNLAALYQLEHTSPPMFSSNFTLYGHIQPALCQLVGLIDEFCAHAAPP